MRRLVDLQQVIAPAVLVVAVGIGSTYVSSSNEIYFLNALVSVATVVAIYVFIGNSGVLSFGQMSFVAVGAFLAGIMTIPLESKTGVLPELFPVLRDHTVGNLASLLLAAAAGGLFALVVGLPLMRLSGLAAGIATFAVLEVTHNILREWIKIGPGATTLSLVPETTDAVQATVGALVVSALDSFLIEAEQGVDVGVSLDLPQGTRLIILGAIMALMLILRPSGLTGGREFRLVR